MTQFFILLHKNKKGKWFWTIKSRNGKILAHSESYNSKQGAMKTAYLIKCNLANSVMDFPE